MNLLTKLNDKEFINKLNSKNSEPLASEIRKYLVDNVMVTGGHLASNLGVVELTLALHKVFDFPEDKIVFDVGHQCYVHKMLSGRAEQIKTMRQLGGISGFPKTSESEFDTFNTGHSSTSVSAALGIARARDYKNKNFNVIAFIGDGALGGGMAFEALNDLGASETKIIIVLNDNEMSIDHNVGGLSSHLSMLRLSNGYLKAKSNLHRILGRFGVGGRAVERCIRKIKKAVKYATIPQAMFEDLGITYIGIIDGHDIDDLTLAFEKAKNTDGPVLVHVCTQKGKGYGPAEDNPDKYHGVRSLSSSDSAEKNSKSYTAVFGEWILNKAKSDKKIVAITAAMCSGCGLGQYAKEIPDRFYDVGIAEQHAVTLAAGLAVGGMTPVFAVYSTFLQRGYDQILHDVCIQNLHVIFAIDRAGVVGEDGETHQGVFDLSYLSHIPNLTVFSPSCMTEMIEMFEYASEKCTGPVAIRYPKAAASERKCSFTPLNFETVVNAGNDIVFISVGRMLENCIEAAKILNKCSYKSSVINLSTIKPLNISKINEMLSKYSYAVTVEDNILYGGVGEHISSVVDSEYRSKIINIGYPDAFISHATQEQIMESYAMSPEGIANQVIKELKKHE